MKQKIQKFYRENEKTILICSGVVIGTLTTTYAANKAIRGMELADAQLMTDTRNGQKFLHVKLRNGSETNYAWQDEE